MPIPVTCPECQYHFLVGDEFAGRPGRCPECAGVIDVPGPSLEPVASDDHADPYPYRTPRAVEAFEDFPSRSRRSRDDDHGRYEHDLQDDYEERKPPTFDAKARAAKWEAVGRGLRNLMVAVVLVAVGEVVEFAIFMVEGVKPGQQNDFGAREKALLIGNGVIWAIYLLLWAAGRIGCARVPYVPARRVATPAAIIAGLTAVTGVLGFAGMIAGLLIMNQQAGAGGEALVVLGFCSLFPAGVGFIVAEIMGLVSQVRMAKALRHPGFGRSSRVLLTVTIMLSMLSIMALCAVMMFAFTQAAKAQQQQQQWQQQQGQPADKNAPPAGEKAKVGRPKNNAPVPPGGPANGPPPPPPAPDPAEHPEVIYAVRIFQVVVVLFYAVACVVCFQGGRAAVRREIAALVGDPDDRDHPHDERY